MTTQNLRMVIVGHVDHGKSTLIGRLFYDTGSLPDGKLEEIQAASEQEGRDLEFGYVMDHLREERERGVTIDTAQAFFSTELRDYVIIDAPGHREFIKNMITGASQAEAAVLICSVFEGVEEQTRRHAYVLRLLGLEQVIVAYNKMDLVGYEQARFAEVKTTMDAFLETIGITPAWAIPISAKCGDNVAGRSANMPWHPGPTILEALDRFEKRLPPSEVPLRFPVQDLYTVDGRPVLVGRVESGVLRTGETVTFLPAGKKRTVQGIIKFNEEPLPQAEAGECVGVLLDRADLARGEVGWSGECPPVVSSSFEASIFWLSPQPMHEGEKLVMRCATQQQQCRIATIHERINSSSLEHLDDRSRIEETEVGHTRVTTGAPLVVERFQDVPELGRFVLLRGRDVVAGGIVTGTSSAG